MSESVSNLGEEHPQGDKLQGLMLVLFLVVWGLDSFVFRFSTYGALVPLPIRGLLAGATAVFAVYLIRGAHRLVIDEPPEVSMVIDYGVFSLVRHPMYLGSLLVYLSLVLATLSAASFVLFLVVFVLYDVLASYEEADLLRLFGEDYEEYRRRVRKWIPTLMLGSPRTE
jgi:protein-S-isoprenylcysteine O-methyltransferase Ste14